MTENDSNSVLELRKQIAAVIDFLDSLRTPVKLTRISTALDIEIIQHSQLYEHIIKNPKVALIKKGELVYLPIIRNVTNINELCAYINSQTSHIKDSDLEDCYKGAKKDLTTLCDEGCVNKTQLTSTANVYFYKSYKKFKLDVSEITKSMLGENLFSEEKREIVEYLTEKGVLKESYGKVQKMDYSEINKLKKKYKNYEKAI
eukprot:GAHX01002577.1.p1 GENE.GAHX01002577.1~~GAHX01002577.1.p1  ORF type:complete len:202 (-),score=37.41 GAHX01002577.1:149-754(-)